MSGVILMQYAPESFPSLDSASMCEWRNMFFAIEANSELKLSNVPRTRFIPCGQEYTFCVASVSGAYTSYLEKSSRPRSFALTRKNLWKTVEFSRQTDRSVSTASSGTSFPMLRIAIGLEYFRSLMPSFLQSRTRDLYISPMTSQFWE